MYVLFKGKLSIALMVLTLVTVDLLTKLYIEENFRLGEAKEVIPGFFNIVLIKNTGMAFGIFSGYDSELLQWGLIGFIFIALGVIFAMYRTLSIQDWIGRVSLILVASGAIGNLTDRFRSGAVTDFLLFYVGEHEFPAFNVADSLITVSVGLLLYATLILGKDYGISGQEN